MDEEYRRCANCWWAKEMGCIRKLCCFNHFWIHDPDYLCYGWRPIDTSEKHQYLEKYRYEHERVGIIPVLDLEDKHRSISQRFIERISNSDNLTQLEVEARILLRIMESSIVTEKHRQEAKTKLSIIHERMDELKKRAGKSE